MSNLQIAYYVKSKDGYVYRSNADTDIPDPDSPYPPQQPEQPKIPTYSELKQENRILRDDIKNTLYNMRESLLARIATLFVRSKADD